MTGAGEMGEKTILVNFVTWPAVGHAVEAFQAAFAYKQSNPDYEVDLVLSSYTAVELAGVSPWVRNTYTVDIASLGSPVTPELYRHIPRDWAYVAYDGRESSNAYGVYRAQAMRHFRTSIATGYVGGPEIPFAHGARRRVVLPDDAVAVAEALVPSGGVHVGLLPGGASLRRHLYPSLGSWSRIVEGLRQRFPDVTVHLLGKLDPRGHASVTPISRAEV